MSTELSRDAIGARSPSKDSTKLPWYNEAQPLEARAEIADKTMTQIQNQLKVQREYVIQLFHQLTIEYRSLEIEQQQIAQQYP